MQIQQDFPVTYQQNVAWGDMDAFGHVNNVMYYRYIESARILYFDLIEVFKYPVNTVVAHNACQYIRPIFYPDTIHIGVSIKEIKTTSMRMEYCLFSQQQNEIVAKSEAIIVFVDQNTMQKTQIPAALKQRIQDLENK